MVVRCGRFISEKQQSIRFEHPAAGLIEWLLFFSWSHLKRRLGE